jgi:DNA-binding NarL/FixJ family response regulator
MFYYKELGRNMDSIRTLLVDDSREFLRAASQFLSGDSGINIIGKCLSTKEALEQLGNLNPDLILMDLAMPEINGLEATQLIKNRPNAPRIIILTMHDTPEYRQASKAVSADGFVAKSDFGLELVPMIKDIFQDQLKANGKGIRQSVD